MLDEIWNSRNPVLMVDSGDMFGQRTRMDREQTRFLCEVSSEFGYDAIGLGERDLHYGRDFLDEMIATYNLPFTSANVRDEEGELILPEYLKVERGGVVFGICSVLDPQQRIVTMSARDEVFIIDEPVAVMRDLIPRMRADGVQTVVLLSHMGDKISEEFLHDVAGIDISVVGHSRRAYKTERIIDKTAFFAASYEGRNVGRADCSFAADGELKAFDVQVTVLGEGMPEDPVMLDRVNAFKEHLEEFRLAARGEYQPTKGSEHESFLSEVECRKCHKEIYNTVRQGGHSSALATLRSKGQSDSPECLVCHTTGYLYKGGYDDRPPANKLRNVQCEACHGYGTEHARDGSMMVKAKQSCVTCHDAENSPEFDYETYWAKIAH